MLPHLKTGKKIREKNNCHWSTLAIPLELKGNSPLSLLLVLLILNGDSDKWTGSKEFKPGTQWSSNHFITPVQYLLATLLQTLCSVLTDELINELRIHQQGRKDFGTHSLLGGNTEKLFLLFFSHHFPVLPFSLSRNIFGFFFHKFHHHCLLV